MYRQNGMLTALLLPLYRVLYQDSTFQSQVASTYFGPALMQINRSFHYSHPISAPLSYSTIEPSSP
jgi:hypothetical protein